MPRSFSIKLHSETQVSGRLGMSGGRSTKQAQNPLSGERRKTLSTTHHTLSPPPSHYHLYIIHVINWLQRFYRITMLLKRTFVPKSDVKQMAHMQYYVTLYPRMRRNKVVELFLVVVCWMLYSMARNQLVYNKPSKRSCRLHDSGHDLWADCQWCTLFHPLNSRTNTALALVLSHYRH